MNIDLRWTLPVVMPFAFLGLFRALYWCAGADWSDPGAAAFLSLVFGMPAGAFLAADLADRGIKWTITIGKKGTGMIFKHNALRHERKF